MGHKWYSEGVGSNGPWILCSCGAACTPTTFSAHAAEGRAAEDAADAQREVYRTEARKEIAAHQQNTSTGSRHSVFGDAMFGATLGIVAGETLGAAVADIFNS